MRAPSVLLVPHRIGKSQRRVPASPGRRPDGLAADSGGHCGIRLRPNLWPPAPSPPDDEVETVKLKGRVTSLEINGNKQHGGVDWGTGF